MDAYKKIKDLILKYSPGADSYKSDASYTTKIMYNRDRIAFTRLFGAGVHIENEDVLFDKRLKIPMNRHLRYFGPRGEILIYLGAVFLLSRMIKNNFRREEGIESLLNDKNVYLRLDLPFNERKVK
jgi:hypothetical protein